MYKIKRFGLISKAKEGWSKLGPKGKIAVGSLLTAWTAYGAKKAYDNKEKIKEKSSELYDSGKYAVTHPKETAKKIGNYIKKNPDEALVLGGSYVIPGTIAAKLAKKGNVKGAALAASVAALPIGESYIAAKLAYKAKKNKDKKKEA
jgi:hypothetical protein